MICPECNDEVRDIPPQMLPSLFEGSIITRKINGLTVYSSLSCNALAKRIIRTIKRDGEREIIRTLGRLMAQMFGQCDADAIIPVPLHLYSERRHNPSRELAEGMGDVWGIDVLDAALWTREIMRTNSLTSEDFRFTRDIFGKRVVLVDDYCLSGRTLSCLAETCRRDGAEVICAYTLASGKPQDKISEAPQPAQNKPESQADPLIDKIKAARYRELYVFFMGEVIVRELGTLTVYSASDYYTSGIRDEIHKLKYSGARSLCIHMGRHMAEKFGTCRADFLVPVPLHLNSDRGYNQSLEIAKGMCELWDAVILDAAVWTREVPRRAVSKDRYDITPHDFDITQDIYGRRIALVDDVCTSGSTLANLAEACRREGAIVVCAYTLASV